MTETHRHQSIGYLEDVQVYSLELDGVLTYPQSPERSSEITRLNQQIGRALKLAQIHAQLATAEAITAAGLTPAEIDALTFAGERSL